MIPSILMQVSRISIGNRYDTGCANTGGHILIINDNNAQTDISMSCSCVDAGIRNNDILASVSPITTIHLVLWGDCA